MVAVKSRADAIMGLELCVGDLHTAEYIDHRRVEQPVLPNVPEAARQACSVQRPGPAGVPARPGTPHGRKIRISSIEAGPAIWAHALGTSFLLAHPKGNSNPANYLAWNPY